jgi:hypothetical protein
VVSRVEKAWQAFIRTISALIFSRLLKPHQTRTSKLKIAPPSILLLTFIKLLTYKDLADHIKAPKQPLQAQAERDRR